MRIRTISTASLLSKASLPLRSTYKQTAYTTTAVRRIHHPSATPPSPSSPPPNTTTAKLPAPLPSPSSSPPTINPHPPNLKSNPLPPTPTSPKQPTMPSSSGKVDIETAKRAAAVAAVRAHFPPNPRFVGIGSGTTIVYVVQAIKELPNVDISRTCFVPTGYQSKQLIINAGLVPIEFDSLPEDADIDVAFDGADEVDEELNCIKGGGACLYQEKLVAMRAKEFICVADHRKLQKRLLSKWPTIPIEVEPKAARQVMHRLRVLGSRSPSGYGPFIREGIVTKAGPIKTDQDFFIIDAPFPFPLLVADNPVKEKAGHGANGIWEVETLAKTIKEINGVLAVGLFCGPTGPEATAAGVIGGQRPVACYFGMEDGSVEVRKAVQKSPDVVAKYPPLEPTLVPVPRGP